MDEQLKARLIGATVLVVLAVLLVPEMLSGRKPEMSEGAASGESRGTRTHVIDLGGAVSKGQQVAPGPAPSARPTPPDNEAPSTSATTASPTGSAESQSEATTVAVAEPEPEPTPPVKRPASSTPVPSSLPAKTRAAPAATNTRTAAAGSWSVQVGAFGSSDSARKLVSDLKRDGYTAYVSPLAREGKTLHRVRVGPESSRDAADRLAGRLKGRGLPAAVVAND